MLMRNALFILLAATLLTACSRGPKPPEGLWIGHYEATGMMVLARLEIQANGAVRVSAPNILNVAVKNEEQRQIMHANLVAELNRGWGKVSTRKMDFDGRVFRNPGGVAPRMEWNPQTRVMKVVFYFGMKQSLRITMQQVTDFSGDPWAMSEPGA